ncbi:MAG: FAS1-like dehydratase domain-containing protein [Actinomycetota bacterium]
MDPAAEGKVYGPVAIELDEERVRAFRELFGGPEGVPPTFLTAAEFALLPQILGDPELGIDIGRVVHGTQEYELYRPLRIGEVLRVDARIDSIRHKGGNGFLSIEMAMRGRDDLPAAVTRSTMIERGADR